MGTPAESITPTLSARARRRAQSWARRRQGPDGREVTIRTRRIYALPTGFGLLFALMVFTMLLGAMNYNNNMGFALTFLLAALGVVSIHYCHRNLGGLQVRLQGTDHAFAGEDLRVHLALAAGSERDALELRWEGMTPLIARVDSGRVRHVTLPVPTERRGPLPLPALRIGTRYPLGLLRAWTWIHMDAPAIVYPRPECPRATPPGDGDGQYFRDAGTRGEEDFHALRRMQPGDPPGRIAWKTYARTGELLVRDYRGGGTPARLWISWDDYPALEVEARISRLTRLVLEADRAGSAWGLRLPGRTIQPDTGPSHLHKCLHCLATHGLPGEAMPR